MSFTASSCADYMEDKVLGWITGTQLPTPIVTWGLGLLTANPADAGTLAAPQNGTEITTGTFGSGAGRASLANTGFNAITTATNSTTGRMIQNTAAVNPGAAWTNTSGSTTTITGVGMWDSTTLAAGNLWIWFALAAAQQVTTTTVFSIGASGLSIQID